MSLAEPLLRGALVDASAFRVPLRHWRAACAPPQGEEPAACAAFWDVLPGGILVAAIADGSGAPRGAAGATLATRHAAKCVRKRHESDGGPRGPADARNLLLHACHAARAALVAAAERGRTAPAELDCALRVVLCTPDLLVCAGVGETGLSAEDSAGRRIEAACDERALPSGPALARPDALERARVSVARFEVRRLVVTSAGAWASVRRLLHASDPSSGDSLTRAIETSRDEREASSRLAQLLSPAASCSVPAVVLVASLDLPAAAALGPGARTSRGETAPEALLRAA